MKVLWIYFALVMLLSFAMLGWIGTRIYQEAPPIPTRVVTTEGQVLIDQEGDTLQVLDLGTRTGIWGNNVRVKRAELRPGDRLTVGSTALLVRYDCERDEGSSAAVPAPSRAFLSRTDCRSLVPT